MEPQLLQLIGSLVAILVLAAIAWGLGLGRTAGIADEARALELAREADSGFEPASAAISSDGAAALITDDAGRIMVLRRHGAQFAARILVRGAAASRNGGVLTLDPADRRFGKVTLDLGDEAQAWVSRINALDYHTDA
ncbi:hypothetical protein [Alteriqipengyuania sp.]|uniref:hypothetical protein n=1 Tax=Alteriqipengyuania sp. TaxID=2800692 RepID=UPI0035123EBB